MMAPSSTTKPAAAAPAAATATGSAVGTAIGTAVSNGSGSGSGVASNAASFSENVQDVMRLYHLHAAAATSPPPQGQGAAIQDAIAAAEATPPAITTTASTTTITTVAKNTTKGPHASAANANGNSSDGEPHAQDGQQFDRPSNSHQEQLATGEPSAADQVPPYLRFQQFEPAVSPSSAPTPSNNDDADRWTLASVGAASTVSTAAPPPAYVSTTGTPAVTWDALQALQRQGRATLYKAGALQKLSSTSGTGSAFWKRRFVVLTHDAVHAFREPVTGADTPVGTLPLDATSWAGASEEDRLAFDVRTLVPAVGGDGRSGAAAATVEFRVWTLRCADEEALASWTAAAKLCASQLRAPHARRGRRRRDDGGGGGGGGAYARSRSAAPAGSAIAGDQRKLGSPAAMAVSPVPGTTTASTPQTVSSGSTAAAQAASAVVPSSSSWSSSLTPTKAPGTTRTSLSPLQGALDFLTVLEAERRALSPGPASAAAAAAAAASASAVAVGPSLGTLGRRPVTPTTPTTPVGAGGSDRERGTRPPPFRIASRSSSLFPSQGIPGLGSPNTGGAREAEPAAPPPWASPASPNSSISSSLVTSTSPPPPGMTGRQASAPAKSITISSAAMWRPLPPAPRSEASEDPRGASPARGATVSAAYAPPAAGLRGFRLRSTSGVSLRATTATATNTEEIPSSSSSSIGFGGGGGGGSGGMAVSEVGAGIFRGSRADDLPPSMRRVSTPPLPRRSTDAGRPSTASLAATPAGVGARRSDGADGGGGGGGGGGGVPDLKPYTMRTFEIKQTYAGSSSGGGGGGGGPLGFLRGRLRSRQRSQERL
ncbi:hypothetical protein HK405_008811 [Cladochytrium tenue]|nr:hypothetical protein HK405_008811 [Cladochytrium tenue]